jgi:tetratricopeptide (TPR) repeat protein
VSDQQAQAGRGAGQQPLHLRVFIASPGDVVEERTLAREVLDRLPKHPLLEDLITLKVIAWDDEHGTPMLGTLSPQQCVTRFRGRPADCDIVIVVLWGRMGTPLRDEKKKDGEPYLSGTEWEIEDAIAAPPPGPDILLYRRTETPKATLDDPELPDKLKQFQLVTDYFAQLQAGQSAIRGFNPYAKPADFRSALESHFFRILRQRLDAARAKEVLTARAEEEPVAAVLGRDRAEREISAAVEALVAEARVADAEPDREATVEAALSSLAEGRMDEAKAVLSGVLERKAAASAAKAAESRAANEAAMAARHLGALAMFTNTEEALAAFRRAAALAPADVWTWIYLARLERQRGDLSAAVKAAQRAREAAEAAGDERDVWAGLLENGDIYIAQGNLQGALGCYRDAFSTAEKRGTSDPGNAEWQRDLSVSHNKIGDGVAAQGDLQAALQAYRASLTIRERLAKADPGNTQWQRDRSISHEKIGDVLVAQGQLDDARARYRASYDIIERLAQADPGNTQWQRDSCVSCCKLGWAEEQAANQDLAGVWYRRAEPIMARLAALDPSNATWQNDLAWLKERIDAVCKLERPASS